MHINDLNLNVSPGTHLAECRKKHKICKQVIKVFAVPYVLNL